MSHACTATSCAVRKTTWRQESWYKGAHFAPHRLIRVVTTSLVDLQMPSMRTPDPRVPLPVKESRENQMGIWGRGFSSTRAQSSAEAMRAVVRKRVWMMEQGGWCTSLSLTFEHWVHYPGDNVESVSSLSQGEETSRYTKMLSASLCSIFNKTISHPNMADCVCWVFIPQKTTPDCPGESPPTPIVCDNTQLSPVSPQQPTPDSKYEPPPPIPPQLPRPRRRLHDGVHAHRLPTRLRQDLHQHRCIPRWLRPRQPRRRNQARYGLLALRLPTRYAVSAAGGMS